MDENESYTDMICKTIRENEKFFQSDDELKKIYAEIVTLADDALGMFPLDDKFSDPRVEFVMNGLQPFTQGIFISALTGNIVVCFMQLRLLVEYLALTHHAEKIEGDNLLEKLQTVRNHYQEKRPSDLIKDFDSQAYDLWKKLSSWHHARTHSKKIEQTVIDEGVKLWSILQPAPYYKEDEKELIELFQYIQQFRKILKKYMKTNDA